IEQINVPLNLLVLQIASHTFSKTSLGIRKGEVLDDGDIDDEDDEGGDWEAAIRRRSVVLQVLIRLAHIHGNGKLLVVTFKALAECKEWIDAAAEHGFMLKSFTRMKGHDDAKGCEAIAEVGRILPPRTAVDDSARMLYADDAKPLAG